MLEIFRPTEQRSFADVKHGMKETAAAILVLIIVSVAGVTTGPGRNSLMKL